MLIPKFTGTLELFEADLMQSGSFDDAFRGVKYIFHTASPFFIQGGHAELVEPAVEGTRNVMLSAAKALSDTGDLKRVILTSSVAAVKGSKDPQPPKNGKSVYSEDDFNETSTVENGEAYWVSKVEAEKVAWDLAKQHNIDLVTILPEFILGPLLSSRTDGTSVGYMKKWIEGEALDPGYPFFADLRDVAKAHVLAAENPQASGRYIVGYETSPPPQVIAGWLRERFPEFDIPEPKGHEQKGPAVDNSKVRKELGLALTPVKSAITDMAVTMIALGLAQPKLLKK
jgi:nucleoside-diphosphate-sugar epimerase